MLSYILAIIFIVILSHYLLFLVRILNGLKKLVKSTNKFIPEEFVSVIIPFRNESENILENLSSIENQDYPISKFEIIYVNDFSEDNSPDLINKNKISSNVKQISVPENFSVNAHKKRAIRYGIENSSGQIIVTTDADCLYETEWLKSLLNNFDERTGFVSGPVEFLDNNKIFSKIQKLEFAGLVLTGAGLIGAGHPTICNAANIAYRKMAFEKVNGFADNLNLSSGDDEFLMQKIAKDTDFKIKFSLDVKSIVRTNPNKNITEFYQQRKRWASKGLFYAEKNLVLKLILIYCFYVGLVIQIVLAAFLHPGFWISFSLSIILKVIFELKIILEGKNILFRNLSLKYFLVTEILQIPYIIFAGIFGSLGNLVWKQRKIRR